MLCAHQPTSAFVALALYRLVPTSKGKRSMPTVKPVPAKVGISVQDAALSDVRVMGDMVHLNCMLRHLLNMRSTRNQLTNAVVC